MRASTPLIALKVLTITALALCVATGCEREKAQPAAKVMNNEQPVPPPAPLAGVHPDDFRCETIATAAQVSAAIRQDVAVESSSFEAPPGVPRGCNYIAIGKPLEAAAKADTDKKPAKKVDAGPAPAQATWSFDIDCRKTALRDGKALISQYAASESSTQLAIGEAAIDHRGVVLIFIDDDTPCYARVLGPDQAKRSAIAKLVAAGLDRKTAPATRSIR